jgi:hypothetical protein
MDWFIPAHFNTTRDALTMIWVFRFFAVTYQDVLEYVFLKRFPMKRRKRTNPV